MSARRPAWKDDPIAHTPQAWRPRLDLDQIVSSTDELDGLNDRGGIAVSFSCLAYGPVHIAFEGYQTETLSVWRTRSDHGFETVPKLESDLLTIRFVDTGFLSRVTRTESDLVVGLDQALCTSFESMRVERASPGFSAITAAVSRDAVVQRYQALAGSTTAVVPQFCPVVEPRTVGMRALKQTMSLLWHQRPSEKDLVAPLLQDLLIYQLISAWPTADWSHDRDVSDPSSRSLRLALDFLEANLGRRIEIAEVAQAAGVTVRGLQIAFKRRLGCSPIRYLIMRRLDRVHADLVREESHSIREVAARWGFTHMSDFSHRYRERFGHLPRQAKLRAGE